MDFRSELSQAIRQFESGFTTVTVSFTAQEARSLRSGRSVGSLELVTELMLEMVFQEAVGEGARGVRFDGDGEGNWVIFLLH